MGGLQTFITVTMVKDLNSFIAVVALIMFIIAITEGFHVGKSCFEISL